MFSRLRCHFCGAKAPHHKTVTEFQCATCEAVNFLDGKGNIVDTPLHVAAPPSPPRRGPKAKPFMSFTRPEPEALEYQKSNAFCSMCIKNHHLYNETLGNYLPDESHPEYAEFERALPKFKKELEERYPLVCTNCAPEAQAKINQADHYGLAQNLSKMCKTTVARGGRSATGQRDDAGKKAMRLALDTIGLVLYAGLFTQIIFHAYGILTALFGTSNTTPDFDIATYMIPSVKECSLQARSLHFNTQCFQLFSNYIPYTLGLAICGLFYNPGLKQWYHHTLRMEAVAGQQNYFYIQMVILAIRCMAWWNLSDPQTLANLDTQQIIATHAFTIFFVLVTHSVAKRSIVPVRWTMRGKMMPKPSEKAVLALDAAPAGINHTPKANQKDPYRYIRNKPSSAPFDINSLAPKASTSGFQAASSKPFKPTQQLTPEYSDEYDDEDPMELDDASYVQSRFQNPRPDLQPSHTYYNHNNMPALGVNNMRDALSSVQSNMQSQAQRLSDVNAAKFAYNPGPSPFYGSLPPAPMSMERRLRNPPQGTLQRGKPEIPMSEKKDFMQLMRNGVKPVEFTRTKENFELKKSDWVLPGDVKSTGLEERFGSFLSLREDQIPEEEKAGKGGFWGIFGL